MKRLIIAAAMFVSLSAFAGAETVNEKVLNAFNTEFTTASEVEWTISSGYFKASFGMNGQRVAAFYNTDGELMGLTRNIRSSQLPVRLQTSLMKNYNIYWVSDLFEVSNTDGTSYYVTLENGSKKIVLKSSTGNDWSSYKKDRKI